MSPMALHEDYPLLKKDIPYPPPYGENKTRLHTLDICFPAPCKPFAQPKGSYWVIFLHGGAWRDPEVDSQFFIPTVKKLLSDSSATKSLPPITAFASINYRLSAYPHLTCSKGRRTSSFGDNSRTAVHPAHINDVLSAIFYLQTTYGFDSEYLLVGHSCGATLALQSIMRAWEGAPQSVTKPCAVAGVEGIYDLMELSDSHETVKIYAEFLKGAFGLDREKWGPASPTPFLRKEGMTLPQIWPEAKVLVLAHSRDDELVEKEQTEALFEIVSSSEHRSETRHDELLWITGRHDEIWEDGTQMAVVVKRALECLSEMD